MQAYGGYLRGICLLAGYLLGGFLTAEAVARSLTGKSARALGTGNPGMANITAQLGKAAGFAVLAGDVAKTVLAIWFCVRYAAPELGRTAVLYAGLGAILGHNWSVWHGFYGGKGVAVTCTWLILYLPVTGRLCCLAGGAAVLLWGYLPVGAVLIPLLAVPLAGMQYGTEAGVGTALAAAVMLSRHAKGLWGAWQGTEPRFFQ